MRRRYSQSFCLVSVAALRQNAGVLRGRLARGGKLGLVVKSDAYGHSLPLVVLSTQDLADLYLVQTVDEALIVRSLVPRHRVIVLGPTPREAFEEAALQGIELTMPFAEDIEVLQAAGARAGRRLEVHAKLETGTHRQGMDEKALLQFVEALNSAESVALKGVSTHFADIEDTLDHSYALQQLTRLQVAFDEAQARCGGELELHCANSAATLLHPRTHGAFVRCGIAAYGLWPSRETWLSVRQAAGVGDAVELRPALSWRALVGQIKEVEPGSFISYGRTYRTTSRSRVAVLGVGYADGYDRRLSNQAHALFCGARLPVRGRVCMNMTMVEVSDITDCSVGDEVILLGRDGDEEVSADQLANWIGTINYEIPTRIAADVPRIAVDVPGDLTDRLRGHGVLVETP